MRECSDATISILAREVTGPCVRAFIVLLENLSGSWNEWTHSLLVGMLGVGLLEGVCRMLNLCEGQDIQVNYIAICSNIPINLYQKTSKLTALYNA